MEVIMDNKLEPTYRGSFRHGWQTMMKYFLLLLLIVIILGMVMSPMSLGKGSPDFKIEHNFHVDHWENVHVSFNPLNFAAVGIFALLAFLAMAYSLLVVPVFRYGANLMFLHAVRDQRPEFDTLISGFKKNYLYIVLSNLLATALIMLGFVFLIIPGIIVACRLAFVSYLVMDKGLDPIVAIEESWRMTRGHGWKIFAMAITSFFIFIGGLILMFVGVLPAIIWVKSSFTSLYESILRQKELEPAV